MMGLPLRLAVRARQPGEIDEPMAYVMDRVAGQEHFGDTSDEDRAAAVDDYLAILARLHALRLEPFVAAGIWRAANPSEAGLVGLRRYEEHYRSLKAHPDPFADFCLGWLRRNRVDSAGRESPVAWDSGQFHQPTIPGRSSAMDYSRCR